jgi:flavin-dependent dehydrogenase
VGARVLRPVRLRSVERDTKRSCFRVELAHGPHRRVLEARVVLDATGRSATLSRRLGASRAALDRMVGVVRWVRRPSPPTLLVEAAEHGFWYSAPAGNGETIFLWMTGARDPSARAADPELWRRCMAASRHTLERFGVGEAMPDACVLPAGPALTTFDPRAGFLPIGDAMVSFDPISGAGLCFALRSALEAVWVVEEMVAGRTSAVRAYAAGARDVLKEHLVERARAYARERRFSGSRFWSAARGAERFLHDAS